MNRTLGLQAERVGLPRRLPALNALEAPIGNRAARVVGSTVTRIATAVAAAERLHDLRRRRFHLVQKERPQPREEAETPDDPARPHEMAPAADPAGMDSISDGFAGGDVRIFSISAPRSGGSNTSSTDERSLAG